METLAEAGMKFIQAYACAICSPTRVSLMTGLNAARHRVTNWTLKKDDIAVHDLHGAVKDRLKELQHNRNVHFNPKGKEVQGKHVA